MLEMLVYLVYLLFNVGVQDISGLTIRYIIYYIILYIILYYIIYISYIILYIYIYLMYVCISRYVIEIFFGQWFQDVSSFKAEIPGSSSQIRHIPGAALGSGRMAGQ